MMTQIAEEKIFLRFLVQHPSAVEPRTPRCNKFINSVSYRATRGDYKSTHWKEAHAFWACAWRRTLVAIIASKPLRRKKYGEKRISWI